jgi:hypothetical protein
MLLQNYWDLLTRNSGTGKLKRLMKLASPTHCKASQRNCMLGLGIGIPSVTRKIRINSHTRKYEPMERLLATASLVTQYSLYKEEFESIARLQFRLSGRLLINASPYSHSVVMDSPSAI